MTEMSIDLADNIFSDWCLIFPHSCHCVRRALALLYKMHCSLLCNCFVYKCDNIDCYSWFPSLWFCVNQFLNIHQQSKFMNCHILLDTSLFSYIVVALFADFFFVLEFYMRPSLPFFFFFWGGGCLFVWRLEIQTNFNRIFNIIWSRNFSKG